MFSGNDGEKYHCQVVSSAQDLPGFPSNTEKNFLPLGLSPARAGSASASGSNSGLLQQEKEDVTCGVVDRGSLLLRDISCMRLQGCRAMSMASLILLKEKQKHHSGQEPPIVSNYLSVSSSLVSTVPMPAARMKINGHSYNNNNSNNSNNYNNSNNDNYCNCNEDVSHVPPVGGDHALDDYVYAAAPLCDLVENGDEHDDDTLSVFPSHPEVEEHGGGRVNACASRLLSSFRLDNSTNLDAHRHSHSRERGDVCTFSVSSHSSSSSSNRDLTPGTQPFSAWQFPDLGKKNSGPWLTSQGKEKQTGVKEKGELIDVDEEVERNYTDGKGNNSHAPICLCHNRKKRKKKNGRDKEDEDDDDDDGNDNDNNNDESSNNNNNNNDDDNANETEQERHYMKRLRYIYALYENMSTNACNESIIGSARENCQNMGHTSQPSPQPQCPSLSFTINGTPSGYYTLGSHPCMQHRNKQFVFFVSPLLNSFSIGPNEKHRRDSVMTMNSAVVSRIEQRVLLQTTILSGFVYHKIFQKAKQEHVQMDRQSSYRARSSCMQTVGVSPDELSQKNNRREMKSLCSSNIKLHSTRKDSLQTKDSSVAATAAVAVKEDTGSSLTWELIGAAGANIPHADSSPVTVMLLDDPSATVHRRALTQVHTWNSKPHSIDGIFRCVDNEKDDLVVYVGMILMGWLEVVDLLGAGTFGQVFLCKDLRISEGHFVYPSEIEGEDFEYWQCSHEYIPFSDPYVMPTHSPLVAVKVVKSRAMFEQQSILEAEMLVYIGAQTALQQTCSAGVTDVHMSSPPAAAAAAGVGASTVTEPPESDPRCRYVAKIFAHGICYGHHCIIMERYGANLFEYVQSRDFNGLPMYQIQVIGRKILSALTLLHEECQVVHCDIKPENILLTIDSCFSTMSSSGGINSHGNHANEKKDGSVSYGSKATLEASATGSCYMAKKTRKSKLLNASSLSNNNNNDNTPEMASLLTPSPFHVHQVGSVDKTQNVFCTKETTLIHATQSSSNRHSSSSSGSSGVNVMEGKYQEVKCTLIPPLQIKIIDFSSSSYVGSSIYTYVQSRYYRAPEVILGAGYGPPIDIWSTGCLLAELLLGLPLLPGTSDFHQLYLIEEMLGPLPKELLAEGKKTNCFYDVKDTKVDTDDLDNGNDNDGSSLEQGAARSKPSFRLLKKEEYQARNENALHSEWKCYFQYRTLPELLRKCNLSKEEKRIAQGKYPTATSNDAIKDAAAASGQKRPIKSIMDELIQQRFLLYDLLKKMLDCNPSKRITAREALAHPFFTYTPKYMQPYRFMDE